MSARVRLPVISSVIVCAYMCVCVCVCACVRVCGGSCGGGCVWERLSWRVRVEFHRVKAEEPHLRITGGPGDAL